MNKKIANKINEGAFLLLCFLLPFHKKLVPPAIIIFVLSSFWNTSLKNIKFRKHLFVIIGFYCLHLIGYFYSMNKTDAAFDLEIKLSLFFLPLSFMVANIDFKNLFNKALQWFVYALLCSTIINLAHAVYVFSNSLNPVDLFYVNASVFHHASYYALYLVTGILILYYRSFKPHHHFKIKPVWIIILNVWFTLFVILLTSKTALLSLMIIHLSALFFLAVKYNKKLLASVFIVLLIAAPVVAYYSSITFQTRMDELYLVLTEKNYERETTSMTRIEAWKSSVEIIKRNPAFGVGTGDVIQSLREVYEQKGYKHALELNLNAHNQYLQTAIALGLTGAFYLIFMLANFFWFGLRNKQYLFSSFIAVVFVNMLTESMLETQSGVVFITFFIGFFYVNSIKNQDSLVILQKN